MTTPASGQISMSQINQEMLYSLNTDNTSLSGRSWEYGNYSGVTVLKQQPAQLSKWYSQKWDMQYTILNTISHAPELKFSKSGGTIAGYARTLDFSPGDENMTWTITSTSVAILNFGGYATASGKGTSTLTATSGNIGYNYGPWSGVTFSTNSPNYPSTTINVTWGPS